MKNKKLPKLVPIPDMTREQLENEINGIEWQIENASSGMWELRYREELYHEISKRKYEVGTKISLIERSIDEED